MDGRGTLAQTRHEVETHLRRAARALFALDRDPGEPQPHLERLTAAVEAICAILGPILRCDASRTTRRRPCETSVERLHRHGERLDDEARSLLAVCHEAHRLADEHSFDARALRDLHEVLGEFVAVYHRHLALCRQQPGVARGRLANAADVEAAAHRPTQR